MPILYLVRHGRSIKQGMIRGRLPGFPLSKTGKEEARLAAEFLADKEVERIFTSPLDRAVQTADIIAKVNGLKFEIAEELNEWDNVEWTGKYFSQISKWQLLVYALRPMKLKVGNESLEEVGTRFANFCKKISKLGNNIVCVSHRDPIIAGKLTLLGRGLNWLNFERCKTGSVTVIKIKHGKVIESEYFEP